MRKSLTLSLIVLLGATGMYFLGASRGLSVSRLISGGSTASRTQDLNAAGIASLNAGDPAGAVEALRQARRLEPEDPIIGRNLSIALARMAAEPSGDEKAAMQLLGESLDLWPGNPEGLDGLSAIHFRAGRYGEALRYARVLQEMMPERDDLAQYVAHIRKRIADEKGMTSESGDHFRLLYSDERRLEYEGELLSVLQAQLDSLSTSLGVFPEKTIDVLLLTEELGSRADPGDPLLEGLYDGQIRLYMGDGTDDSRKMIMTVRHEMVHALLHQAAGDLPGWIHEGIAQKAGEDPPEETLEALRQYLLREVGAGYEIRFSELERSFIGLDSAGRARAYASSLLFMDYLGRVYGSAFIPRFVADLAQNTSPRDAFRAQTGHDLADLQKAFTAELKEEN